MTTAAPLFSEGVRLHRAGRLVEAEQIYRQVLGSEPQHCDCLHLLGLVFLQQRRHALAIEQIDRALARDPGNVFAWNNRGIALKELNRLDEAVASYDRAIAAQPNYAQALMNRGNALQLLNRYDEALASYDRALAAQPDYAEALLSRGNALRQLKRLEDALASYDRLLALRSDSVEAHTNRAAVLAELRRFDEALASCDRALALRADVAEAHATRANILCALNRRDEALACLDRAIALRPDLAEVHYNRGNILQDLRRFDAALASYDRALALRPDHAEAHYNRANLLHVLKRYEDALAGFDQALQLRPDHAEAAANRGAVLHDLGRHAEALASLERASALRPALADSRYNEALCRLLLGDFARGWQDHEWRWETEQLRNGKRHFRQPLWLGSDDIGGKTILLHAEQGLGDTIQFCRYAPLVAACGGQIVLEVQPPLRELMRSLLARCTIVSRGEALPDFDTHCPLLSLPLAFGTRLDTIPSAVPYLAAQADKHALWRDRLGPREGLRIGLVWAGNPRKELPNRNRIDAQRSICFDALSPLFDVAGCRFYSLQKGVDALAQLRQSAWRDRVIDWTDELHDFSDTAALVENLDLVISVDTSVAHLAGALGKPFWLLNRYNTCWRWLVDRDDSPWYPTARLFRQDATRDWSAVIARVRAALAGHHAGRS